jgi:hypothetical protein
MILIIINILKGIINMKQLSKSLLLLSMFTANLLAGEETVIDGYIRGTYQKHDVKDDRIYRDDAIGGKLHFETAPTDGIALGASYYGTTEVFNDDNRGLVPLRGETDKSYSILGELYIKYKSEKSIFKIGRQEIETPFAQTDDIGMIPNTFESAIFINNSIPDTTVFLAQINKMSGVDAKVIDKFTKINGSKNMQVMAITYEGIKNLVLSGWYHRLKDGEIDKIVYIEGNYANALNSNYSYELGIQYAKQNYSVGEDAQVFGGMVTVTSKYSGLTVTSAYTKVKNRVASSGFGGGPFFSNSEYLIIDNAGEDGKATLLGLEIDGARFGYNGLSLGLGKITLETKSKKEATEIDFVASYQVNKKMEFHLIYSDLQALNVGEDDAKHLRVFANYNF